ncbi:MAG: hypothetical protein L6M37_04485 [Candidatus Methylarchaceae archaeon HK02M1]|nr:hypothetical protein [Candidatus Methylarchaceae archaeon HK02M1]
MYKFEWENRWVDIHSNTIMDFIAGVLCPQVIFERDKIDVIADLGCGHRPKSDILNIILKPKYRILLDIGLPKEKDGEIIGNSLYVKADMEELLKEKGYDHKRRIAKFIGLGDVSPERIERELEEKIDIALFSDVLNYVDYKLVLDGIHRYIAKGGRVIILNKPRRGYGEFFSDKGVKSNWKLIDYLESKRRYYTIERCLDARRSRPSFGPWREVEWAEYKDDNTWILLILKKETSLIRKKILSSNYK